MDAGSNSMMRPLRRGDEGELEQFFSIIDNAATRRVFHPHAFDAATARNICSSSGKDAFIGCFDDSTGAIVGYGLMRGWDEGFEVPSIGLCLLPEQKGRGLGRRLLEYLLAHCRQQGAPKAILKVRPENAAAIRLYETTGFEIDPGRTANDEDYLHYVIVLEQDA